jgi:hypothetical protein
VEEPLRWVVVLPLVLGLGRDLLGLKVSVDLKDLE